MDNVFQIGGQVSGDSFIGRTDFVSSIRKSFVDSDVRTAKSIVGLTRMGKSSAVRNSFFDLPENVIFIYEDLNEWSEYNELWQDICYEIRDQLELINIQAETIEDCFTDMEKEHLPWIKMSRTIKKIFGHLSEINIKTILILDEFDNASTLFNKGTKHFELFRTIFSDGKYNVFAITISRRNLYTIEGATYQSSTFHGVLDIEPFKGFNKEDMKEYFEVFSKYGIELDDGQKKKIVYYAGNAPYLLSIIGHYIVETVNFGETIDIDKIFLGKCKSINDYYRDCIKHLERDDDLRRIIPFIIGPNIGVSQNDKDELFNLGYFREENGNLIAISEYFMAFLSANMLQIDIWDNIINLEKKLKQLIERELTKIVYHFSAAGDNINNVLRVVLENTPGIAQSDISRYDSFISNNRKVFNLNSSYLDVMSMNDAIKIIKECWGDIFSAYFNNDLYSEWDAKFRKCSRARNPIAHGHEEYLTDLEKQEVDTYCKQIFDILAESIRNVITDSTPFLEIAKANMDAMPLVPEIDYKEPVCRLLGSTANMFILEIGGTQKNNLRGVVDGKYRAVITKNYLVGIKLGEKIGHMVKVELEKINNGRYEVRPFF